MYTYILSLVFLEQIGTNSQVPYIIIIKYEYSNSSATCFVSKL